MKLYYRPKTSGRPMRAAWLLEELGADYETVPIEDTSSDEHHARSPLGRVPVLEFDDGTMLFDSTAILFALADRHPDAGFLAPLGTRARPDLPVVAHRDDRAREGGDRLPDARGR